LSTQNRTQNRNGANSKVPISSHPLFPAIVALWFGALFGLGSLAVRVSLIESLIIASHVDVVVPMAAPPLGMTARILIALFMGMIGIATGAFLARRINRPRPASGSRRRTAGSVSDGEARKAALEREARAQEIERQYAAEKAESVRRRALASDESNYASHHRDEAPIPGAAPQILDVTQFDLAAPGSFEMDLLKQAADEAPLDLSGYAAPQTAYQEPAAAALEVQPVAAAPARFDPPAPVIESYGDDTESFRAKFANEKKPVTWVPEPPPGYVERQAAAGTADFAPFEAAAGRQDEEGLAQYINDFAAPAPAMELPTLDPTQTVAPVADDAMQAPEAPEAEASPGLRRFDAPAGASQPSPVASPLDFGAGVDETQAPAAHYEAAEVAAFAAEPDVEPAPVMAPSGNAGRIASAELAELSPVELVERFALALKQRRHSGAFPAALLETAAAFDLPLRPQASQVPDVLAAMAATPEPEAAVAPETAPVAAPEVAPAAPHIPEAFAAAAPLFAAPLLASSEVDDAPVVPVRTPLTLPAAMRPIEFGAHDGHGDLPDYVPPRSFVIPRAEAVSEQPAAIAEDSAAIAQPLATPMAESGGYSPAAASAEPSAEPDVNEEGYSSLLALSKSAPFRQTFVRIDEPEGEFSQVEPVVIFPGQATRPGTRFARPSENSTSVEQPAAPQQAPMEMPQPGASGLRRFDAPTTSAPSPAVNPAAPQDPAEAERALRSALATLQRMSGAA